MTNYQISESDLVDLSHVLDEIIKYQELLRMCLEELEDCENETPRTRIELLIKAYMSNIEAVLDLLLGVLREFKQ